MTNTRIAILGTLLAGCLLAQDRAVTIVSRWGVRKHSAEALQRAVEQQSVNAYDPKALRDCKRCQIITEPDRREAAQADVYLPEVVKVDVDRDTDGNLVIGLTDIDGNHTTIWTRGSDEGQYLPVTSIEPY